MNVQIDLNEEDLERKLQEGRASAAADRTYSAEEVFARLHIRFSENESSDQQPD